MAKLNNLYYQSVVFWDWSEIQYFVERELSHDDLTINEIERVEDDINITFEIEDEDKEEDVLSFLKQYCDNEAVYREFLGYLDEGSGELVKDMVLNIFTKILRNHDKRIEVKGLEASYHGVSVRFDFEKPLVKTAIAMVSRDTVFEDLRNLMLKVTEDVNESYLESKVEDAINKESQLDFVVEDALTEYMGLHFSNYSIDILDSDDFDKSIVSIALGC